jgi:hypothetical protein
MPRKWGHLSLFVVVVLLAQVRARLDISRSCAPVRTTLDTRDYVGNANEGCSHVSPCFLLL